ncbi:hypothetical protein ACF0H5_018027 [Mactra antiquata]
MNINDRLAIVPRNACASCWRNVASAVYFRDNIDLHPDHLFNVLSEFCSNHRDSEGNRIAIIESCQGTSERTSQDKVLEALFCFLDSFSFQTLFALLDSKGFSTIGDAFCSVHSFDVVDTVTPARFPESRRLQQFYYILKNFFDNNVINVENRFLKEMFYRKIESFEDTEGIELQLSVNKLALVAWLRIQQCKRDTLKIRKVLNIYLKNIPAGVDKTLVLAVYYSKMAIADALDGDAESAMRNVHAANSEALHIVDPLKVFLCHDRRYVYQLLGKHENELNQGTKRALAILDVCDPETNCNDFVTQVKRMFLLYSSQYHLGIGNDLKINENFVPMAEDMLAARGVLHCFEQTIQTGIEIEPRRLMIYDMCKAKFLANGDSILAEKHLVRALECAEKGAKFGREKQNVEGFWWEIRRRNEQNRR